MVPYGFQQRVTHWSRRAFVRPEALFPQERSDRFCEEAIELLQASGYDKGRILELVEHVYSKPPGKVQQEAGAVLVTLAALLTSLGVVMDDAGADELARISKPEVIERIRAKDAAKLPDTALPGHIEP